MPTAIVDTAEIILTATLSIAGLMLHGLEGAVIGAAIGSGVTVLISAVFAGRIGFRFFWADYARVAVATGLMAVVLAITPYPQTALGLGLAVLLGAGTYGTVVVVLYRDVVVPMVRRKLGQATRSRTA